MPLARMESIDYMDRQHCRTNHVILIMGAFTIGLAFRLIRLGILPLTHLEADYAMQALAVARNGNTIFGDQMAYVGLTAIDFFLLSPSNFIARFWPALTGALIVLIPYLFRKQIGLWPATIAAVILAISPEMVGLSRIVGSPMMAMVFVLLTLGFWFEKKPIMAGVCVALGLMSGPGFWVGAVILGLSYALSDRLFKVGVMNSPKSVRVNSAFWTRFGFSFGVILVLIGTSFFMAPSGLSGVFSGLITFIRGFGPINQAPFGLIPFALLAYGTGAVVFGLWGGIRGILIKSRLDRFLFIWAAVGFSFLMVYPSGGPADLLWVTMPLWILTARVLFFTWRKPHAHWLVVVITAVIVVVASAFMLLALRTLVTPILTRGQQINYLIALLGSGVLMVAIVLLVSYGWNEEIARVGLLLGVALVFSAGMISVSVNSTGLSSETPFELWYPDEPVLYTEWLTVAIDRVMVWNSRGETPVGVVVAGLDTPGLQWALHQYDPLDFVPFVPPQTHPGILITEAGTIPEISYGYQGQDLVWSRRVPWRELSANQYLTWLVTRDAPTIPEEFILWVRTDLMPGGQFVE